MKVRWYRLLTWMLGIMGFSSGCAKMYGPPILPAPMYGCPHSQFTVKIKVTDENGTPIKGIEADDRYDIPKKYTDENGEINTSYSSMSIPTITLKDVDGEANGGEFLSAQITHQSFEIKQTEAGDGIWYDGAFDAKVTVSLKKK